MLDCYFAITLFKPNFECTELFKILRHILIDEDDPQIKPKNNKNKNFCFVSVKVREHVKRRFLLVLNSFHSFTLFTGYKC